MLHPFSTSVLLLHGVFEHGFQMRLFFQIFNDCNQNMSFQIRPRIIHDRRIYLARLLLQTDAEKIGL